MLQSEIGTAPFPDSLQTFLEFLRLRQMMGFIRFELGAGGLDLGLNDGHGQKIRADRKKLQFEMGQTRHFIDVLRDEFLLELCGCRPKIFPWE
jgi:hypothetical protein